MLNIFLFKTATIIFQKSNFVFVILYFCNKIEINTKIIRLNLSKKIVKNNSNKNFN